MFEILTLYREEEGSQKIFSGDKKRWHLTAWFRGGSGSIEMKLIGTGPNPDFEFDRVVIELEAPEFEAPEFPDISMDKKY